MSSLTVVKYAPVQVQRLNCRSVELMQVKLLLFLFIITIIKLVAFVQSLVNYDKHVKLTSKMLRVVKLPTNKTTEAQSAIKMKKTSWS